MITEEGPEELVSKSEIEGIKGVKEAFLIIATRMKSDGIADHATVCHGLMSAAVEASIATVGVSRARAWLQRIGMRMAQDPNAKPQ